MTIKKKAIQLIIKPDIYIVRLLIKPGLHEPQMQVEWSFTVVSSVVVERDAAKLSAQQRRSTTLE